MPAFDLSDLVARVYDRVDNNTPLYTKSEVVEEINDAVRTLNLYTGFIQTSASVPGFSVKNQVLYAVPSGILFPVRVDFEGRQLQRVSLRAMALRRLDWLRDTSASGQPVQHWTPIGMKTFAIHPADSRGGGDIFVTGIAEPTRMVFDTGALTVSDEDAETIEELAAHALQFKEGGNTFAQASLLFTRFLSRMKRQMRWKKMAMPRYFVKFKPEKAEEEAA